jgi:uncharacterized protein (DUF58 family)
VGPLTVRLADPFGMVELVRSFSLSDTLTVTPTIVALPPGRVSGAWTGGGDSVARAVSAAGEDDVTPREYRHGDDLRRVHWRSTARHGELMVRREEQHLQSSGTLFLDTRRSAHWGDGPGGTFEQAVSAAASVGVHLARTGMNLRYVTDEGEALPPAPVDGAFEGALLDALAVARTSAARSLSSGLAALRGGPGTSREGDGLVVAVLAALSVDEARSLAATRRGTATGVAILIVGGGGSAEPAAAPLRAGGWRVVAVRSAAELPAAWTRAGQSGDDLVRGGA